MELVTEIKQLAETVINAIKDNAQLIAFAGSQIQDHTITGKKGKDEDEENKIKKEKEEEREKKRKAINQITQEYADKYNKIADQAVAIRDKTLLELEKVQNKLSQDPHNTVLLEQKKSLLGDLKTCSGVLSAAKGVIGSCNSVRGEFGLGSIASKNLPTDSELKAFNKNIEAQLNAKPGQNSNPLYQEMPGASNGKEKEYALPNWVKLKAAPKPAPTATKDPEPEVNYRLPTLSLGRR